jgi:hypothetical protein
MAHRLTDEMVAKPVVLIERSIEPGTLTDTDRAHHQRSKVNISHAATSTSRNGSAPQRSHQPRSAGPTNDFATALGGTLTGSYKDRMALSIDAPCRIRTGVHC